jgi:hypothetical protein
MRADAGALRSLDRGAINSAARKKSCHHQMNVWSRREDPQSLYFQTNGWS